MRCPWENAQGCYHGCRRLVETERDECQSVSRIVLRFRDKESVQLNRPHSRVTGKMFATLNFRTNARQTISLLPEEEKDSVLREYPARLNHREVRHERVYTNRIAGCDRYTHRLEHALLDAWRIARRQKLGLQFEERQRVANSRNDLLQVVLVLRFLEQLLQVLLPKDCPRMGAMAVSLGRCRDQHKATSLHPLDLAFRNSQFRRIDEIISRIYVHHWSRDFLQTG